MPRPVEEEPKRPGGCCASKTRLELILIGVLFFAIVVVIVLIFLVAKKQADFTLKFCGSSICLSEAAKIADFVDPDTKPCDDFYLFACGNFLKQARGDEKLALPQKLEDQAKRELFAGYVEPIHGSDHKMVKMAKKLFRACMNETEIERDNIRTLKEVIQAIGGWPVVEGRTWNEANFHWIKTSYQLRALGYKYSVFLELGVDSDPQNNTRKIFKVDIPYMWDYSSRNFDKVEFMTEVAMLFGAADRDKASGEMAKAHDFLIQLQMEVHNRHNLGTRSKFTVEQYQEKCPSVRWLEYINYIAGPSAMISKNESAVFPPPDTMESWVNVISKKSKRIQANFMIWKVIEAALPYLTDNLRNRDGRNRVHISREDFCLREIQERFFPSPIDIMCDRKYLPKEKKEQVAELLLSINSELVEAVKRIEWMDPKDKDKALKKAKAFKYVIGQAENYFDDKTLDDLEVDMIETKSNSFLSLLAQADRNRQTAIFQQVKKSSLENLTEKWYIKNGGTLPFYSEEDSLMYIPAVIAGEFLYNEKRPNYLNYGALGALLGHQLSVVMTRPIGELSAHTQGVQVVDWKNQTKDEMEKRAGCMEKQLEDYKLKMDEFNFRFLLQRSIGEQISYWAYEKWAKNHGEEQHLIGMDYTPKQLFWISSVPMFCQPTNLYGTTQRSYQQSQLFSAVVSGSVRNNPQFAKDFNCPEGSKMNPTTKCKIL